MLIKRESRFKNEYSQCVSVTFQEKPDNLKFLAFNYCTHTKSPQMHTYLKIVKHRPIIPASADMFRIPTRKEPPLPPVLFDASTRPIVVCRDEKKVAQRKSSSASSSSLSLRKPFARGTFPHRITHAQVKCWLEQSKIQNLEELILAGQSDLIQDVIRDEELRMPLPESSRQFLATINDYQVSD